MKLYLAYRDFLVLPHSELNTIVPINLFTNKMDLLTFYDPLTVLRFWPVVFSSHHSGNDLLHGDREVVK